MALNVLNSVGKTVVQRKQRAVQLKEASARLRRKLGAERRMTGEACLCDERR